MSADLGRRGFVAAVASLTTLAFGRVDAQSRRPAATTGGTEFDVAWLDAMKGRHKQLYDLGTANIGADPQILRYTRNFLDTSRDFFHLESPQINTAVGISGPAFAMNASDRLWAKYKLGERGRITDPATKQPAVRNIFLDGSDLSIKALQARGTVFWQCNVALGIVAQQLADTFQMPVAEVRADLIAGLNPGVKLMPSHMIALALAQEHGFTYMKP